MGYTHYFKQSKSVNQEAWDKICQDVKVILKDQKASGVLFESNHPSPKMVDEVAGYINFNGVDDDSHETFEVTRDKNPEFNFCKTARKPYDLAVTATLMVIEHHAPNHYETSSDGDVPDWKEAAYLNHKLFGYGYAFPSGVRGSDSEEAEEIEKELGQTPVAAKKVKTVKKTRYIL